MLNTRRECASSLPATLRSRNAQELQDLATERRFVTEMQTSAVLTHNKTLAHTTTAGTEAFQSASAPGMDTCGCSTAEDDAVFTAPKPHFAWPSS